MKKLISLPVIFLYMFLVSGCSSAPDLAESTAKMTAAVIQPSKGGDNPTAVPLQPVTVGLGTLSPAIDMTTRRATHTATRLLDGKVLITGGFLSQGTSEISIASAEIYDPETNTFTPTGEMNETRRGHAATLLPNGQVLIVGGWGENGRSSTAELYDPATGGFIYTGSMFAPRGSMSITPLENGKVLIAGGNTDDGKSHLIAEIYDPADNRFTQTGSLNHGRSAHTATLLDDGRVLLTGGRVSYDDPILASAEIYDPGSGEFTLTGSMNIVRYKHAAILLPDGDVLVVGGSDENDWTGKYTSAEIYHTGAGEFSQIADLNNERFKLMDAAVMLPNGNVLVGGGNRQLEIFDTQNQRFIKGKELDNDYYFSVITLLNDGRVLITGGYDSRIRPSEKAWIYENG